eukprot:scaffold1596_cov302-Pinguiococcus_pyrenoidosus.AAC.33
MVGFVKRPLRIPPPSVFKIAIASPDLPNNDRIRRSVVMQADCARPSPAATNPAAPQGQHSILRLDPSPSPSHSNSVTRKSVKRNFFVYNSIFVNAFYKNCATFFGRVARGENAQLHVAAADPQATAPPRYVACQRPSRASAKCAAWAAAASLTQTPKASRKTCTQKMIRGITTFCCLAAAAALVSRPRALPSARGVSLRAAQREVRSLLSKQPCFGSSTRPHGPRFLFLPLQIMTAKYSVAVIGGGPAGACAAEVGNGILPGVEVSEKAKCASCRFARRRRESTRSSSSVRWTTRSPAEVPSRSAWSTSSICRPTSSTARSVVSFRAAAP